MDNVIFGREYVVRVTDDGECITVCELVRCKDCARNPEYTARTHCPCYMDRYMGPDGWCAFARRKDNGKDTDGNNQLR